MENDTVNSKNSLHNDKLKFYIDAVARYCDKCGNAYTPQDVKLVQDTSMTAIIHFSCSNCKSRHIATFLKPVGVSSRSPINTDLSIDEISSFASKREVKNEDVLNLYLLLKKDSK